MPSSRKPSPRRREPRPSSLERARRHPVHFAKVINSRQVTEVGRVSRVGQLCSLSYWRSGETMRTGQTIHALGIVAKISGRSVTIIVTHEKRGYSQNYERLVEVDYLANEVDLSKLKRVTDALDQVKRVKLGL